MVARERIPIARRWTPACVALCIHLLFAVRRACGFGPFRVLMLAEPLWFELGCFRVHLYILRQTCIDVKVARQAIQVLTFPKFK